jgi:hypothetical protein
MHNRFGTRLLTAGLIVGTLVAIGPFSHVLAKPASAKIVYQTSFDNGSQGWRPSGPGWRAAGGMLSFNGKGAKGSQILAPINVRPPYHYAVEAQIRADATPAADKRRNSAGVVVRAAQTPSPCNGVFGGYAFHPLGAKTSVELRYGCPYPTGSIDTHYVLDSVPLSGGQSWHTYRMEADSAGVTLWVDGHQVSLRYTGFNGSEGGVGLLGYHVAFSVRDFKVYDLD